MIQANHPRFSCTPDMSLTIYVTIFSGPLMTTDTPSGLLDELYESKDGFIKLKNKFGELKLES